MPPTLARDAYPLVEIRPTILYRAIRADGISVNCTLPPSYNCLNDLIPIT